MVLILGGAYAGKTDFARSLGYTDFSDDVHADCPVVCHLEATVYEDPDGAQSLLPLLLNKEIVICREVGSGVIPLDPKARAWREAVGRLCAALAKEATAVVRVVAGIPVVIKGVLPCACD